MVHRKICQRAAARGKPRIESTGQLIRAHHWLSGVHEHTDKLTHTPHKFSHGIQTFRNSGVIGGLRLPSEKGRDCSLLAPL